MNSGLLLSGATIYTCGPQGTVKGDILIEDGRVTRVSECLDASAGTRTIDAAGRIITPGFVDAHSHLGTALYGQADSSDTSAPATPSLRILDSFDPMDPSITDALAGGVTTVMLHPGAPMSFGQLVENINVIAGQSAVIKTRLRGRSPQVLREPAGVKMALGEHPKRVFADSGSGPHTRMKILAIIREHLLQARDWLEGEEGGNEDADAPIAKGRKGADEFKYRGLVGLLDGTLQAHVHVHKVKDIRSALGLAEEYGLKVVLEHATEADEVAAELAERDVPCVVGPLTFSKRGSELARLSLQLPARLEEAGVKFALMSDHPTYPAHQLPLIAGVAEREGTSYETALLSITRHAAEIIGVSDRVGSLEPGKDADLVVHTGDPLEAGTRICGVMCDGEWCFGYRDEGIRYDWLTGREES